MSGYTRVRADAWEEEHYTRASWLGRLKAAPAWWIDHDLAWAIDRRKIPSAREAGDHWAIDKNKAAKVIREGVAQQVAWESRADRKAALLQLLNEWASKEPKRATEATRGTGKGQGRDGHGDTIGTGDHGSTPETSNLSGQERDADGTGEGQGRDTSRERLLDQPPADQPPVETPPLPPAGVGPQRLLTGLESLVTVEPTTALAPPAEPDVGVPSWVPSRKGLGGADRHATWMGVVSVLEVVNGEPVNPYRCKTDGTHLVKFWEAQGKRVEERPPVAEFLAEVLLVAKAFRACPHPLFARDVRAEGWEGGTNRMDQVPTLVVQKAWGARLREARRWAEAGFPETWQQGGTGPPGVESEEQARKRRMEERIKRLTEEAST